MANPSHPPDGKSVRFGDEIDEVLSLANPNPGRVDCPGSEVLAELATRRRPIGDPGYEHLLECSPCYREFRALQDAGRGAPDVARDGLHRGWLAIAAVALLLVGITAMWFLLGRQRTQNDPASANREAPRAIVAEVDLRPFGVARSDQGAPGVLPVSLPAGRVDATLFLPVGSEPGPYDIQLLDTDLKSLASSRAEAVIKNYVTTVQATLDLRSVPRGTYQLAVRRQGDDWRMFPARVE